MWYSTDPRNSVHSLSPLLPHNEVSLSLLQVPITRSHTYLWDPGPTDDWGLEEPSILYKQNPQVTRILSSTFVLNTQSKNHSAASNRLICPENLQMTQWASLVVEAYLLRGVMCEHHKTRSGELASPGYASWILPHHLAIELEKVIWHCLSFNWEMKDLGQEKKWKFDNCISYSCHFQTLEVWLKTLQKINTYLNFWLCFSVQVSKYSFSLG